MMVSTLHLPELTRGDDFVLEFLSELTPVVGP
jgi:hypothetical protein